MAKCHCHIRYTLQKEATNGGIQYSGSSIHADTPSPPSIPSAQKLRSTIMIESMLINASPRRHHKRNSKAWINARNGYDTVEVHAHAPGPHMPLRQSLQCVSHQSQTHRALGQSTTPSEGFTDQSPPPPAHHVMMVELSPHVSSSARILVVKVYNHHSFHSVLLCGKHLPSHLNTAQPSATAIILKLSLIEASK